MKYTVEGFSQKALVGLGLNLEETLLLRWFVDFQGTGKLKKIYNEGKEYCWINYQSVSDDLPIIASNKYKVSRLFESMVEKKLFERFTYRVGGVYSTFRLVEETYNPLVEDVPSSNYARTLQAKVLEPSSNSARTNNPSTNQSTKETIPENKFSENKKEKKGDKEVYPKETYKEIIDTYFEVYKSVNDIEPILVYPSACNMIKKWLKNNITKEQIINAVRNAKDDEWVIKNGFTLNIILSEAVFTRLVNIVRNSSPLPRKDSATVAKKCPTCGSLLDQFNTCPKCHVEYDVTGRAI